MQYPNALPTMMLDLSSIRQWAGFLQKTEIKFDMLSAVDELAGQVRSSRPKWLTVSGVEGCGNGTGYGVRAGRA